MLRAQLRRIALPRLRPRPNRIFGAGSSSRAYGSEPIFPQEFLPPVPVLRPALWALTATATIFLGCAAYDVHRDVQNLKRRGLLRDVRDISYDELQYTKHHGGHPLRASSHSRSSHAPSKYYPPGQLGEVLAGYNNAEKVVLGFSALNISLVLANYHAALMQHLGRVPCLSPDYTMLTSAFGHTSLLHAALNTFVLLQFAPQVAGESHLFAGNGPHFTAFYLSAGILSSFGDQIATILPTRNYKYCRLIPNMGAGGIISALIATWATLYPDARIGMLLVPKSYSAEDFLLALVVIETFGLFVGIPLLKFNHGVHLAGMALGAAYAHYDGRTHVWQPACKAAFAGMKRLHLV
ncbi:rhomboid-domain-containing protein [Daldinia bambusicola]|nr:rhomboid-domain-containing protein [Daldinia bambusicola]